MRNTAFTTVLAGLSLLSTAQGGTLIQIPAVPGSTSTYVTGINDNNVITGFYRAEDGINHGFVGRLDGQYQTFDWGDVNDTEPRAINNDGYITGFVFDNSIPFFGPEYIRAPDGEVAAILSGKRGTELVGTAQGIDAHRNFVGDYWDQSSNDYGYYGKGHTYRAALTLPFNTHRTRPRGLNKDDTAVGYYNDNLGVHGFVLKDGTATSFNYPDQTAYETLAEAINSKDIIVGAWTDLDFTFEHPFIYDLAAQSFEEIAVNGATFAIAYGINKSGVVTISASGVSYIYCIKEKTCPPVGGNRIELADKWIPASAANVHALVCRHRCLKPLDGQAMRPAADPDLMRYTIQHDAALRAELGRPVGR
jgi:hypothetical protein